jgi:hypothetical protein
VNQFGPTNGNFDQIGGMFQNRKDSFRGGSKNNTNSQSPNIAGGRANGRSRGNSK